MGARQPRKRAFSTSLLMILALSASLAAQDGAGPEAPSELKCEYLSNPLGIDALEPRLSWILNHSQRGEKQTAYQVLVASRPELLNQNQGDQWDSRRVESEDSIQVVYHGRPVKSGRAYYWKVRYWDKEGRASPYSTPARFEMGLLNREEWKGRWITGRELRKAFRIDGKVSRARLYVTALGYYEIHLNGKKVGTSVLDPAWTTYPKRVLYSTYDVTNDLRYGENALGAMLGGGWATLGRGVTVARAYYPEPALLLQLSVEFEDGRRVELASDGSWKAQRGPIVSDSIYDGEVYDARLEASGWDQPGFDDSSWKPVEVVAGSNGILSAQMMPPIRVADTLMPRRMTNPQPGVFVFDLGQNMSGWAQLRVRGPRGTPVEMRYAETIHPDGILNRDNLRQAKARDIYILRGDGEEVFEPHFTYHGFRYVEVTGFPGTPSLNSIRGRVVHTDIETIGSFAASTPLLNDIQRLVRWTQLANLFSIPTDCPQRDERQGWLGDAQISAEEAMLNFDLAAFYANFVRDIHDTQGDDGSIPETVPEKYGNRPSDPAWGSAYPILCWYMWQQYGDRRILEENYDGLKKYVESLHSRAPDNVLRYNLNGDWIAIVETPGELISDGYYYYDINILKNIAGILGRKADEQTYSQLAGQIKEAYARNFFDPKTGQFAGTTQTAKAMALYFDLVPEKERGNVAFSLEKDVHFRHNNHLSTGFIGTKYLMSALADTGRIDLAYHVAIQTTYPSWGYMLEKDATTIWEQWEEWSTPWMNSHNHPALASVGAWFYQALAGIHQETGGEAYRHLRIAPPLVEGLSWVSASIDTIRGPVSSSWNRAVGKNTLEVTVPVNSDAEIVIPVEQDMTETTLREGGRVIWQDGRFAGGDEGVSAARAAGATILVNVGSGHYAFELTGR